MAIFSLRQDFRYWVFLFSLVLPLNLSSVVYAEHTLPYFGKGIRAKYKKIENMQLSGEWAVQEKIAKGIPASFHPGTVLFAFDLDETLTNYAYRGKKAKEGVVHLKPGMGDLFKTILKSGHRIAVVTANVSSDVESFLMDELGFDFNKEEEYVRFRELIRIKQPSLPLYLKSAEFLKPHKGRMIREAIRDFNAEDAVITGVIFSDDKTGFHYQVLSKTMQVPVVGLRVGHRKHVRDPIGSHLDKEPLVRAGTSFEFARLVKDLATNHEWLASVLEHANETVLTNKMILELNNSVFKISPWQETEIGEKSMSDNRNFGPWVLQSYTGLPHSCFFEESDTVEMGIKFQCTRKFYPTRKPMPPRYLAN